MTFSSLEPSLLGATDEEEGLEGQEDTGWGWVGIAVMGVVNSAEVGSSLEYVTKEVSFSLKHCIRL